MGEPWEIASAEAADISLFAWEAASLLEQKFSGKDAMLRLLAIQELFQKECGRTNITISEARHAYRHGVLQSIGIDPETQPGRVWEAVVDPAGPPYWKRFYNTSSSARRGRLPDPEIR